MIAIINYGMGNLGSIANMIKKVGYNSIITSDKNEILSAEKLVLPGVGSFDNGISNINELGLFNILDKKVTKDKTPILGICLGMQLMTKKSEEGNLKGFGWFNAETKKINQKNLKIPHIGWNTIKLTKKSQLINSQLEEYRYYFVHSYYVKCKKSENILATTTYGENFTSMINEENIYGVQFHPEKSHHFGMEILKNFANL